VQWQVCAVPGANDQGNLTAPLTLQKNREDPRGQVYSLVGQFIQVILGCFRVFSG